MATHSQQAKQALGLSRNYSPHFVQNSNHSLSLPSLEDIQTAACT